MANGNIANSDTHGWIKSKTPIWRTVFERNILEDYKYAVIYAYMAVECNLVFSYAVMLAKISSSTKSYVTEVVHEPTVRERVISW